MVDNNQKDAQTANGKSETAGATPAAGVSSPKVFRPEVVRRTADYASSRPEQAIGGYNEGKRLIVGRDIELNGAINACEKLVVEGRVEASISDCREIEISETGLFKGEAEIDVAEVSGTFEGALIARQLLIIRATGRVFGDIRYGSLEIERGGQLDGEVGVIQTAEEGGASAAPPSRTA